MNTDSDIKNYITAAVGGNFALEHIAEQQSKNKGSTIVENLLVLATSHIGNHLRYSAWVALQAIGIKYQREIIAANGLGKMCEKLVPETDEKIKVLALKLCHLLLKGETPIHDEYMIKLTKGLFKIVTPDMPVDTTKGAGHVLASIMDKCSYTVWDVCERVYFLPLTMKLLNTSKETVILFCLKSLVKLIGCKYTETLFAFIAEGYALRVLDFITSHNRAIAKQAMRVTQMILFEDVGLETYVRNRMVFTPPLANDNEIFKAETLDLMSSICRTNVPFTLPEYNTSLLDILFALLLLNDGKADEQKTTATAIANIFTKMQVQQVMEIVNHIAISKYMPIVFQTQPAQTKDDVLQAFDNLLNRLDDSEAITASARLGLQGVKTD